MGENGGRGPGGNGFGGAIAPLAADSPLHESCDYIVSNPGKGVRAAVLADAARYGSRPDDPLVKQAGMAIELFHAATLAHDDVVDDGQLRRGKPAVGTELGNLAASLSGGWLFARAVELIAEIGDEASVRFADTAATVCEGEMLETRDLHDVDRSEQRYLAAIEAKTACLIAFAAWLGAEAGGASAGDAERLERYGMAVGMAFQIADDILDLLADPAVTGKTPGSDLRQGVYTLPVIYACEAEPSLRAELVASLHEEDLPDLVRRVRATGAVERTLRECTDWIERAYDSLPPAGSGAEHGARLVSLADAVAGRVGQMAAAS